MASKETVHIENDTYHITEYGGVYKNNKGWRSFPNFGQALNHILEMKREHDLQKQS